MRMNLVKLQKHFGIVKMEGKAYIRGEVVCKGEFLMATGMGYLICLHYSLCAPIDYSFNNLCNGFPIFQELDRSSG